MDSWNTSIRTLKEDFRAVPLAKALWYIVSGTGCYHAIFLYRVSRLCLLCKIPLLPNLFRQLNVIMHGCDISPSASISGGLRIPHTVGTVIGSGVTAGKGCVIYQNVTLGQKDPGNGLDYPSLGDNVRVYAGAVVLGAIRIEDHAIIAANSVVIDDVVEGDLVGGVPAHTLRTGPRRRSMSHADPGHSFSSEESRDDN